MLPNDNDSLFVGHLDHVLIVYISMEHVTWKSPISEFLQMPHSVFPHMARQPYLIVIPERLEGDTELHTRTRLTVEDIMDFKFIVTTTYFSFRASFTNRSSVPLHSFPASSQFVYGMVGEASYCHGTK